MRVSTLAAVARSWPLVSCYRNRFAVSPSQDLLWCLHPGEGMLAVIPGVQEPLDGSPEGSNAVKYAAASGLALEQGEPGYHLIHPARAGRGEVQMEAWVVLQPSLDRGVLMGAVVSSTR